MRKLDFIIIGAQKGGTTSLFKYVSKHPQVYMPPEKEAPFFCHDKLYNLGWDSFGAEHFGRAPQDATWGKATPHYMCDPVCPERIHSLMPEAKLIALLRHPVERALSHYKMSVRRGRERRSFEQAVEQLLDQHNIDYARSLRYGAEAEANCYLVWGEYGRILMEYRKYFSESQLLVLFSEDLLRDPLATVQRVFRFLGVDDAFIPANLGKRYHQGGTRRRFAGHIKRLKNPLSRAIWRQLPLRTRRYMLYWFIQVDSVPDDDQESISLDPDLQHKVIDFFTRDVEVLEEATGVIVPWSDFLVSR